MEKSSDRRWLHETVSTILYSMLAPTLSYALEFDCGLTIFEITCSWNNYWSTSRGEGCMIGASGVRVSVSVYALFNCGCSNTETMCLYLNLYFWLRQELKKCWSWFIHPFVSNLSRAVNLHLPRSESNQRAIRELKS